jgi:RimJ/RimL family protein N-acetyltransferase
VVLKVRPAVRGDLGFVLALEADPEAAPWITRWSRSRHEQALEEPDEANLLLEEDAQLVGFALLAGLTSETRSVELRRIVVESKGKGVGRRALGLILDFAFDEIGAHRVWLDVKTHNDRARRAYEAVGFVQEGILRDALRCNGRYESLAVMSMLEVERAHDSRRPAVSRRREHPPTG